MLNAANAYSKGANAIPAEDAASAQIESQIQKDRTPTPARDAQGNLLSNYRPSVGQRILRGVAGAGRGFLESGLMGAAAGAIDPRSTYSRDNPSRQYAGYGDPNKAYQTAEQQRQGQLAAETQNLADSRKAFQDRLTATKDRLAAQRIAGQSYHEAGQVANEDEKNQITQQEANTKAQTEQQQAADRKAARDAAAVPKTVDQIALAKQQAIASGDKARASLYDGALKEIAKLHNSMRAPKDTSATDVLRAIQVSEFRMREIASIRNAEEADRARQYAAADKDPNVVLSDDPDAKAKAHAAVDAQLDKVYGPEIQKVNDEADKMLGLTKAGVSLQRNPPSNSAKPPRDYGPAPKGAKDGRTGTLPDGTRVIVRNGRIVAAQSNPKGGESASSSKLPGKGKMISLSDLTLKAKKLGMNVAQAQKEAIAQGYEVY